MPDYDFKPLSSYDFAVSWTLRFTASLYERADEVEQDRAEREPEYEDGDGWEAPSSPSLRDDVDAMFNGVRDEISASLKAS